MTTSLPVDRCNCGSEYLESHLEGPYKSFRCEHGHYQFFIELNKILKKNYRCSLCKVNPVTSEAFRKHLGCNLHKKRITREVTRLYDEEDIDRTPEEVEEKTITSPQPLEFYRESVKISHGHYIPIDSDEEEWDSPPTKGATIYPYKCLLCDVKYTTSRDFREHIAGTEHYKNMNNEIKEQEDEGKKPRYNTIENKLVVCPLELARYRPKIKKIKIRISPKRKAEKHKIL